MIRFKINTVILSPVIDSAKLYIYLLKRDEESAQICTTLQLYQFLN